MKITHFKHYRRRDEAGSAVVVIMAMLAILMIFAAINVSSVHTLGRELKLIEQKQNQRLQKISSNNPIGTAHE